MKLKLSSAKIVFALAFTATVIGFSSFRQKPNDEKYSFREDQSPKDDTTRKRNRNWTYWQHDKMNLEMRRLDEEMKKLDDQMKHLDEAQFHRIAAEALEKIDFNHLSEEINETIKNISEKDIELNEKHIAEVQNMIQKVKEELQHQKLSVTVNANKFNPEVKTALLNAKKSIATAKQEIIQVKEFTDALEKDKLIDKSKAFKLEVKEGELFIDGIKQSQQISDKYKRYYMRNNFTITMAEEDDFWL